MFVEPYAKFRGQVENIQKPNLMFMLKYIIIIYEDHLYIKLPYPTWQSNYYYLESNKYTDNKISYRGTGDYQGTGRISLNMF